MALTAFKPLQMTTGKYYFSAGLSHPKDLEIMLKAPSKLSLVIWIGSSNSAVIAENGIGHFLLSQYKISTDREV
jgi:hypothetical protein